MRRSLLNGFAKEAKTRPLFTIAFGADGDKARWMCTLQPVG